MNVPLINNMILDIFIALIATNKNIFSYQLTFLKRIIIGAWIAPHGITDILNQNFTQLLLYHIYLLFCCIIDIYLPLSCKLFILTILSIRHLSDDIGYFGSIMLHFISIVTLDVQRGFDLFFTYLTFIHIPIHYYKNIKSKKDATIVLLVSLLFLLFSLDTKMFISVGEKLPINGIIWNHIIFSV